MTRLTEGHRQEREPAAEFDSTRENSPGLDTARIHRLIAFSSFSVWWCMAVFRWCSDFLVNSDCARDLSLQISVMYDSSLISSWRDFVRQKYPFSALWQVNSVIISANCLIYAVTVFNVFNCFRMQLQFSNYSACAATVFPELIQHKYSVARYGAALSNPDCWKFKAILSCCL